MTTTQTLIICNCDTCAGRKAYVNLDTLPAVLLTKGGKVTKAATHGLVWQANHPTLGKGFPLATAA